MPYLHGLYDVPLRYRIDAYPSRNPYSANTGPVFFAACSESFLLFDLPPLRFSLEFQILHKTFMKYLLMILLSSVRILLDPVLAALAASSYFLNAHKLSGLPSVRIFLTSSLPRLSLVLMVPSFSCKAPAISCIE